MTGFGKKMVHIKADPATAFEIEIDFLGNGAWEKYDRILAGTTGYNQHIFPDGFSAHWVRLVPLADCTATAEFFYT